MYFLMITDINSGCLSVQYKREKSKASLDSLVFPLLVTIVEPCKVRRLDRFRKKGSGILLWRFVFVKMLPD